MVGIIDYDMGNIGSIRNMVRVLGGESKVISAVADFEGCDRFILPGVGRFDLAMQSLRDRLLLEPLNKVAIAEKRPVLGICLGMQLLCEHSDEGDVPGLGWLSVKVKRMIPGSGLQVPHMGWNVVHAVDDSFALFKNIKGEMRFYFVHSYAVTEANPYTKGICNYGQPFSAVVASENIFGFQCHPEKSHKFGLAVYENFLNL